MASPKVPFHAKTAILDLFVRSENPQAHPETVRVILDVLQSEKDLRAYFFRNQPHPAWVPILWENGFFDNPPEPQQTQEGIQYPFWDVQEYLLSVASKAPEYFLRHLTRLGERPAYISRAIDGLSHLSTEDIEQAMPRIIEWLADFITAQSMKYGIWDILFRLARERRESALLLFDALLRPFPNPRTQMINGHAYNDEAISPFSSWYFTREEAKEAFDTLKAMDSKRLAESLEAHLRLALRLEKEAGGTGTEYGWWRKAIEPSMQNDHHHHKDYVLDFLRDATEVWVQEQSISSRSLIERYINEPDVIFRRLGLHLLRLYSDVFPNHIARELLEEKNYDDSLIHHEFLLLLQYDYAKLNGADRSKVVEIILHGPPKEALEQIADNWAKSRGMSKAKYMKIYAKHWILNRLWVVKDSASTRATRKLRQLVAELGEPDHPTYLSWRGPSGFVSQESPLSSEQLAQYSPEELSAFMKQWQPVANQWTELAELSYEGLGKAVARIMIEDVAKYKTVLLDVCSAHPDYADALFSQATEAAIKEARSETDWSTLISLCEDLLHIQEIRTGMKRRVRAGWIDVRKRIIDLLHTALSSPNTENTMELRFRVRDLLLLLLTDPDPTPADDRPPEGWFGHDDPFTLAINHVRSNALILLIEYALLMMRMENKRDKQQNLKSRPERLEPIVQNALTEKLRDESSTVHSVYGRFLMDLHRLDNEWTVAHLDVIFPSGQSEEEIWAYVSAWDSYVIANQHLEPDLMERLHPYYERAIENLRRGYITKTHLGPVEKLAEHLVFDYYERANEGNIKPSETLLYRFFEKVNPEYRAQGALAVRNRCDQYYHQAQLLEKWWPATRTLWQDRVQVTSSNNNPPEFQQEMSWFAQLLDFAPAQETIASLWGLLQGTLVYLNSGNFHFEAWNSFEDFIARQVKVEPRRSIELFTQMHELSTQNRWFTQEQELRTRRILEVAASKTEARQQALDLIDYLRRKGDLRFHDIYERWSGS